MGLLDGGASVGFGGEVRELTPAEWAGTFALMQVLRPGLASPEAASGALAGTLPRTLAGTWSGTADGIAAAEALYLERLRRQAGRLGYRLTGAFAAGADAACGLIGLRPVETLSRGGYFHIDDLIVAPEQQRGGVGAALMGWAAAEARKAGLQALYLDARPTAIPFYERLGLRMAASPSMWVELG